ncbi:MAG: TolC family protein [Rhodospirillales bacterium]|nr:TolC family protein [Rhodospirillales bacterium]
MTTPVFPVLAGALLTACSLTPPPPYSGPQMESTLSGAYAGSPVPGAYEPAEWWRSLDAPALDRIVEAVLDSNHDLIIAVARLEQARAGAGIAGAAAFPLVRPSAGGNDFETPTNAGIGAQLEELGLDADAFGDFGLVIPEELGLTTYSLAGEFAYEVDFWGRNRSTVLAAGAERAASEFDFLTARIGILAETIDTYIEIADLRRQRGLARENAELIEEREQLATSRYERGLIGASRLYAVRRDLRNARAEPPRLDGAPPLPVGKFVDVEIEGLAPQGYFRVRRAALQPGNEVWAVDDNGAVTIVPVRALKRGDDEVYVTGALEDGQAVIVGGIQFATNGMLVRTGAAPGR